MRLTAPPDGIYNEEENTYITGSGQLLLFVHPREKCHGTPCVIHNQSNHNMRGFPTFWRQDKRFMERVCDHGVGHPDPDDPFASPIHGCDGCCFTRCSECGQEGFHKMDCSKGTV
jgi:hypothetical protein